MLERFARSLKVTFFAKTIYKSHRICRKTDRKIAIETPKACVFLQNLKKVIY